MYLGINTGAGDSAPLLTTTPPPPQPAQLSRARAKQRGGRGQHRGGGATAEGAGPGRPLAAARSGGSGSAALPRQAPALGGRCPAPCRRQATEHGGAFRCLLSPRARCLWAQRVVGGTGIAGGCCCPKAASWQVTRLTPNAGVRMGTQWFDFQLFLDTTKKV